MIVVTGGAGFIGSNIIKGLNAIGRKDIILVEDLQDGHKIHNIADLEIADYIDAYDFLDAIANHDLEAPIEAIFHQGACSETTEWDGNYMMNNNYQYSKDLLRFALDNAVQFIYASSASVYGGASEFAERRSNERPLNVYAYSKFLFDQYVRAHAQQISSQVVGLRYFNVYGAREQHKGKMASVAYHFNNQILETGVCRLFKGCDGYADGEQLRDFVYVDDVVALNIWLLQNPQVSGIFNCGTGRAQSFNDVAKAVIQFHQRGSIEYIDFPESLKGAYQSYTQADLSNLRKVGYQGEFKDVASGVAAYMQILNP